VTQEHGIPQRDHDAISQRAYELYEARGSEEGHAEEDWAEAERELYPEGPPPATDPR
jgi:hypothetical protein